MTSSGVEKGPTGPAAVSPPEHTGPAFNLKATVISVTLGTALEYVDFALYGLATALVFQPLFFPDSSPAMALIKGFAIYGIGFLARPVGAIFFGWLGDKIGRKMVLIITLMLMGLSTSAIGLLPTYATAGIIAPLLLMALRLCQGFGAGAELSGGAIMLTESAPMERRGLIASLIAFGSNTGVLLASLTWVLITTFLPEETIVAWAWRIPFVCSIIVAIVALYLRRKMAESPVFAEVQESAAHVKQELQAAGSEAPQGSGMRAFIALLGLRVAENAPSYLSSTFIVGYVTSVLMMNRAIPANAVLIGSVLGMGVAPLVGLCTDKFGRRPVYRTLCAMLMVFPFIGYALMDSKNPTIVFTVIVVGFVIASVGMFAGQAAFAAELFGSRTRFRKMALGKEIGSLISGGVAPFIAAALLGLTGHWWIVATYFAVMASIGFVTTFFTPETRGRDLHDPNDAM